MVTLGFSFWIMGVKNSGVVMISQSFWLVLGLALLLRAWIQQVTTELAVTSKRVVAKFGLIQRNTIELNHSKVESFNVHQGIAGRIFGFGTIVVHGTGGGKTPIPNIDSPLQFRSEAMQAIDTSQDSAP